MSTAAVTDSLTFGGATMHRNLPAARLIELAVMREEGVLAGSSSGTLLAAALRYCREQTQPKRVVTFACDTGNRYLSKLYNDYWMEDQGFAERRTPVLAAIRRACRGVEARRVPPGIQGRLQLRYRSRCLA